jgi:hypothetical protein
MKLKLGDSSLPLPIEDQTFISASQNVYYNETLKVRNTSTTIIKVCMFCLVR